MRQMIIRHDHKFTNTIRSYLLTDYLAVGSGNATPDRASAFSGWLWLGVRVRSFFSMGRRTSLFAGRHQRHLHANTMYTIYLYTYLNITNSAIVFLSDRVWYTYILRSQPQVSIGWDRESLVFGRVKCVRVESIHAICALTIGVMLWKVWYVFGVFRAANKVWSCCEGVWCTTINKRIAQKHWKHACHLVSGMRLRRERLEFVNRQ